MSIVVVNTAARYGGSVPAVIESAVYTNEGGASAGSLTFVAPGSITAGDLLLLIAGSDESSGSEPVLDMSSAMSADGWTKYGQGGSIAHNIQISVFWKIAEGDEGNVTVESDDVSRIAGWYYRISGAHQTTPLHQVQFSTSSSQSYNITGVTTTVDNCIVIASTHYDDNASFTFNTAGWTEQDDQTDGSFFGGAYATALQEEAGATGNCNVTANQSANQSASVQVAIAPA